MPISRKKAELYAKYRLPYSVKAVNALIRRTGDIKTIADIGAGTGLLTRHLAGRGETIYAVEPDQEMRRLAIKLFEGDKSVVVLESSAEKSNLVPGSIDLIIAGNAYHRFNPGPSIKEFKRILKPGGWLAIFSYNFLGKSQSLVIEVYSRLTKLPGWSERIDHSRHENPVGKFFGGGVTDTIEIRQTHQEDWRGYWGATRAGIEAPEPGNALYLQFEAIHREIFDLFAENGSLEIEYATKVIYGRPAYKTV